MAQIDTLPPDQKAVLSLLLKQGKSYDDLAGLLRLEPGAVRKRAHDALLSLGPREGSTLTQERGEEIADYLLGQRSASQRAATRAHLEGSAAARAWARVVAAELRPLAGDALPEIPAEGAEMDEAFDALQSRTTAREHVARSSRLGGAMLLGGLGILVAVVLVLVLNGGSSSHSNSAAVSPPASTAPTSTAPTSTAPTSTTPQVVGQVNLTPPHGGKALGIANVLTLSGQLAVAIQAQALAPTTTSQFYAVWLYNSPTDSQRLGFAPPVTANGRLQATSTLTTAESRFHQLIITREAARAPTSPGNIVLAGPIAIPSQ
jgi:Sigma-70, region 4